MLKFAHSFCLTALLMLFCQPALWAYDAYINGIYYNFSGTEAVVTYESTSYNSYSGNVTIPSSVEYNGTTYSVTSIDSSAFYGCTGQTDISISNCVTSIDYLTFGNCTGLTCVEIPKSLKIIGSRGFDGCTKLTSIEIPSGVERIDMWAFQNCTSLTNIAIPSSVTSIGDSAFYNTAWFNNQPDGLVYIGKFAYCYKGLMPENTNIKIIEGTIGIADAVFESYTELTSISIPSSVTSIGNDAFYGCRGLTSIEIPNSVTSVGEYAFYGCI